MRVSICRYMYTVLHVLVTRRHMTEEVGKSIEVTDFLIRLDVIHPWSITKDKGSSMAA